MREADETVLRCSLCGKRQDQVRHLFSGPNVLVCDDCVRVARDVFGESGPEAAAQGALERPVAIIPARYGSSRFPGKPLAVLSGKPMIQHVWERCQESGAFSQVLVATDDERIAEAVRAFGGLAQLTSAECESGTDRVAEVARALDRWLPGAVAADAHDRRVFVNVQGDEPAIHPQALATLARAFEDPKVEMATLVRPLAEEERSDPNVVKALVGVDGHALYFSRGDLPYCRNPLSGPRRAHVGIYGYRWTTLLTLASLPPSPLERAEGLEQLRALENGIRIACRVTEHSSVAVDRPEDLAAAEALLRKRGQ